MEKEYNKLTKQLIAEGYTVENHPEYVQVCSSRFTGDDPLDNIAGGFEYKRYFRDKIVYKTGCGKHIMGSHAMGGFSYIIDWNHENDNPVFRCPYDKPQCEYNDKRLWGECGGGLGVQCFCTCHKTEDPYDFDNSIEKANKEREDERTRKYQEYSQAHNGRICQNHMYYDEHKRTWKQRYDPVKCARSCMAQNGYCPILNRHLSRKRGNVYYDLRESGAVIKEDQISLFEKDRWEKVTKGIRYLKKPCSMDICEAIAKTKGNEIRWHFSINHAMELMMDETYTWEIYNIRAETKPSRDLMQDLQDLKDGIPIIFEDDMIRERQKEKKEKRQKSREKAIFRLEKKILEIGYENLPETSLDRVHADKWIEPERLEELEHIRQKKIKEEQEKPIQLSLFD